MSYFMFYGQKKGNSVCGLFSSVFKKIIPNNATSTFQEVGGET